MAPAKPTPPGYDRAALERELVRDEGEKLRVYLDTAKPPKRTIGVGRNLDAIGIRPVETEQLGITLESVLKDGITRPQSRAMLGNDIDGAEADLDAELPWWRRLDPVRQRVLLNMCFNLGIRGLLGFIITLRMIRAGDYETAARQMKASRWHDQVGDRAVRLEEMMGTGRA